MAAVHAGCQGRDAGIRRLGVTVKQAGNPTRTNFPCPQSKQTASSPGAPCVFFLLWCRLLTFPNQQTAHVIVTIFLPVVEAVGLACCNIASLLLLSHLPHDALRLLSAHKKAVNKTLLSLETRQETLVRANLHNAEPKYVKFSKR